MKRVPLAAGIALTLLMIVLNVQLAVHAGALWRDEANSAALTENLSSIHWTDLQYDSFPAGWFALLRCWIALAGHSDESYRLFGFVTGLAVIAAVWLVAQ